MVKKLVLVFAFFSVLAPNAVLAQTMWLHQNGSLTSNGQVVVKSTSGGAYVGAWSASGAVANRNQDPFAAPPVVHMQTVGVNRWSLYYKDRINGLPAGTSGGSTIAWDHQNGNLTLNSAITILSLSGGSYTGTVNPGGANVVPNANSDTQMPTILIVSSNRNQWSLYYNQRALGIP